QDPKDQPLMMWNPPWTVAVLEPFLRGELGEAAHSWLVMNLVMVIGMLLISVRTIWGTVSPLSLVQLVVCMTTFPPLWEAVRLGQLGVFLGLVITLSWWALTRGKNFLAGVALAFITVKPHLMLVASAVLVWHDLRFDRLRSTAGFITGMLLLITVSE